MGTDRGRILFEASNLGGPLQGLLDFRGEPFFFYQSADTGTRSCCDPAGTFLLAPGGRRAEQFLQGQPRDHWELRPERVLAVLRHLGSIGTWKYRLHGRVRKQVLSMDPPRMTGYLEWTEAEEGEFRLC